MFPLRLLLRLRARMASVLSRFGLGLVLRLDGVVDDAWIFFRALHVFLFFVRISASFSDSSYQERYTAWECNSGYSYHTVKPKRRIAI